MGERRFCAAENSNLEMPKFNAPSVQQRCAFDDRERCGLLKAAVAQEALTNPTNQSETAFEKFCILRIFQ